MLKRINQYPPQFVDIVEKVGRQQMTVILPIHDAKARTLRTYWYQFKQLLRVQVSQEAFDAADSVEVIISEEKRTLTFRNRADSEMGKLLDAGLREAENAESVQQESVNQDSSDATNRAVESI